MSEFQCFHSFSLGPFDSPSQTHINKEKFPLFFPSSLCCRNSYRLRFERKKMEDQKTDDWLPPGWKVEVRQRRNGKTDKCYYAPSGEVRFISRAEVCRYLDKCGYKAEEKEKASDKPSAKNVTVEKVAAEGLPPGWIKEVRITKKGHKVRRDPFYTDPVSGYIFRSMKDALRYVETGEHGRLALKPKDKDSNNEDLEEENTSELASVERHKVDMNGNTDEMERQSAEQVSSLSGITREEEMFPFASAGEQTSVSKLAPNQHKAGVRADLSCLKQSEANGTKQLGGKDSEESENVSDDIAGVLLDKPSNKNEMTKDETEEIQQGRGKTKHKKALNIPRRASKRLAGVALDPTPELKTTRACRSSTKQLSDIASDTAESCPGSCIQRASKQTDEPDFALETNCSPDASKNKDSILAPNNIHSSGDMLTINGHVGNSETKTGADQDKGAVPLGNAAIPGLHSGKVESDIKANELPGFNVDMPLADLWADPCIVFAIQTLTGASCDSPKISEPNGSQCPEPQAIPEFHGQREENGNKSFDRLGFGINLPVEDQGIPKEHSVKVEKGHKTDEKPEPSLDTPLADIWADPCIEFAIKTLTGAIPVEYDLENQDYFQQQPSSSLAQSSNHLSLPGVGMNNFSQTDFISQQYNVTETSMSKERAIRNPMFNYTHHRSGVRP